MKETKTDNAIVKLHIKFMDDPDNFFMVFRSEENGFGQILQMFPKQSGRKKNNSSSSDGIVQW